ncbi:hypothetical protein [Serratia marcescens]|uniref:hypothetical protein n=1 Tax=Serratia marcescens TaxID=615 RepID=UPI0006675271|nr:hypothetical protein [Serratia marcescens]BEN40072.1 hypothetical protein SMKC049_18640 [Serratia marcescens]
MIDKNQVVAVRSKSAGGRIFGTDVNNEPHLYESLYPEGYVSALLGQLEDERAAREQWQMNCRRVEQLAEAAEERAEALAVENASMREALDSIRIYSSDTLSGPSDSVPDMAAWLSEGNEHLHQVSTIETPATDAALAAIQARAKVEAIEQLAIQLEQLPDYAFDVLSDAAEFETYQEEHHTFVSISNPRAVANAVLSLVKEQPTELREAK